MALPVKGPLPQPSFPWTDSTGKPTQAFALYLAKLDTLVAAMAGGNVGALANAANDGAAMKLGVAVGQIYRNGSVLMVRVT